MLPPKVRDAFAQLPDTGAAGIRVAPQDVSGFTTTGQGATKTLLALLDTLVMLALNLDAEPPGYVDEPDAADDETKAEDIEHIDGAYGSFDAKTIHRAE